MTVIVYVVLWAIVPNEQDIPMKIFDTQEECGASLLNDDWDTTKNVSYYCDLIGQSPIPPLRDK